MNHLSSISRRSTTICRAGTLMSKSHPQRDFTDDGAVAILRNSILVVEDDLSVAGMLKDAFTSWGYDVVLASNGREGLHVLAKQSIDGILLDINMPVMGGRTMLDEMRWLGYQTPVVVMSGGLDVSTLRQLVKEGAQGFTVKPFSLPSLRKLCVMVFGGSKVGFSSDAPVSVVL